MSYEDEFEDYDYYSYGFDNYDDEEYQEDEAEDYNEYLFDNDEEGEDYNEYLFDNDEEGEEDDQYYADDYNTNVGFQGGFYLEDRLRFRSVRDIILARMHGILENSEYLDFSNDIKNKSINLIEKIPEKKIILYSIDIFVPVSLYMSQYNKIVSKSNVVEFFKKTSGLKNINHLDFIRYIRIVNNLENDGLLVY